VSETHVKRYNASGKDGLDDAVTAETEELLRNEGAPMSVVVSVSSSSLLPRMRINLALQNSLGEVD